MNNDERYLAKERLNRYDEIEESKKQILKTITALQKEATHSVVFWTFSDKCGGYDKQSSIVSGLEPYRQLTLDYLNMLYETMSNEQKGL